MTIMSLWNVSGRESHDGITFVLLTDQSLVRNSRARERPEDTAFIEYRVNVSETAKTDSNITTVYRIVVIGSNF